MAKRHAKMVEFFFIFSLKLKNSTLYMKKDSLLSQRAPMLSNEKTGADIMNIYNRI